MTVHVLKTIEGTVSCVFIICKHDKELTRAFKHAHAYVISLFYYIVLYEPKIISTHVHAA